MKLKQLLLEAYNIFSVDIIVKTDKNKVNKVDVFNTIRALPDVITLSPIQLDSLEAKNDENYEWSYLKLKYLVIKDPNVEIDEIRGKAIRGFEDKPKVEGLLQFIIRHQTIKKIK